MHNGDRDGSPERSGLVSCGHWMIPMLWSGGRADKISNKLAGGVACLGGSVVDQPRLLGSRVRFPAGAFAIFSVSAKASLPISLSPFPPLPFPSSSFPFLFLSLSFSLRPFVCAKKRIFAITPFNYSFSPCVMHNGDRDGSPERSGLVSCGHWMMPMLWSGGRADKISNKLAGGVACLGGSVVDQPRLLWSRVRFPAGAFAIFSVSAKASLPISLSPFPPLPFPSSSVPFLFLSLSFSLRPFVCARKTLLLKKNEASESESEHGPSIWSFHRVIFPITLF